MVPLRYNSISTPENPWQDGVRGIALFFLFGREFVGAPLTIVMWTSGEKMNYLKDIVLQFNQEKHTTSELFSNGTKQPIHIDAYTVNSGTMAEHLVNRIRDGIEFPQGITPPIWSPPASIIGSPGSTSSPKHRFSISKRRNHWP